MLCIRVLTVFLCPGPDHRAVIACSFAIQVVSSDRHLVVLVFQKTSGFVGIQMTVWNLYWKCVTWLSLWFKLHGKSNVVTVPCFLGRNLWEANKYQLQADWKLITLRQSSNKLWNHKNLQPPVVLVDRTDLPSRQTLRASPFPFFLFFQSVTECVNYSLL